MVIRKSSYGGEKNTTHKEALGYKQLLNCQAKLAVLYPGERWKELEIASLTVVFLLDRHQTGNFSQ